MRRMMLLATTLAVALAAPAAAQDVKPAPCGDNFIEDATGDPEVDVTGSGLFGSPGGPETDITRAFLSVDNGVVSGNIEVATLAKKVPGEATGGVYYYFFYVVGGAEKYVVARVHDSSTVEYRHGTFDPNTGVYTNDSEEVAGKFLEGPGGVVSMVLPAADAVTPGTEVPQVRANVDTILGLDDEIGLNGHVDEAPNDGGYVPLKAEPCTPAAPAAPATVDPAGQPSTLTTLPFRAPSVLGKASKAKKGKALTLRVEALRRIERLEVSLKAAGGKGATLASGSLAALEGKGTLRLKLKRALKKGRYALLATGTVDGKALKSAQQVRLK